MRDHLNASLDGRYTIERQLGRGGMASVWLARDVRHQRLVAIKVMHPELAAAIGGDRFIREIRFIAKLQHPNIIPLLDSGVMPSPTGVELPWYAMGYVAGESLRERLDRDRHLPVDTALAITEAVAAALTAAHHLGIVHRDIKPENVLLAEGQVYVADFGIAKALIETGGETLTSTGLAIGTPAYMSPEQAMGDAIDARTDQYSLATVLYEMLAGEPPFTGPTAHSIVARRMAENPRGIRSVRSSVTPALEAVVLKALERVPADRYPDVTTFVTALRRSGDAVAGPRQRRHLWMGVLAGLLVAATGVGLWLARPQERRAHPVRDSAAVALYQRGVRGYDQRTPEGVASAIEAFTAAINRDSTYAEAWAGLGQAYVRAYERRFVFPGIARDSVAHLAVLATERAMALDDHNSGVWTTQAMVSRTLDPSDLVPALRSVRRAVALDSNNAQAWHLLAVSLAESGHSDEALEAWRRCVRVNPSYVQGLSFLGLAHYWRRQYDSAAHWTDSSLAVDPNNLLGRHTIGLVAVERGQFIRALGAFDAARRLGTDVEVVNALAGRAMAEVRAGNQAEARRVLAEAESLATSYVPTPLHTAVYMAQAYAGLDKVRAIAWLRRYQPAADLHYQHHLRCDPPLDPVRSDSAFQSLLRASDLPLTASC